MGLPTIKFNIASDGIGRLTAAVEKVPGLVMTGVTVVDGVTLGEVYQIFSLKEAEDLKIEQGGTNDFAYNQIRAFYNEADTGTPLWFMLVSDATTMSEMADKDEPYAAKLIAEAKGAIRVLGILKKSDDSETIVDGIDQEAGLAVPVAQTLAEHYENQYIPFRVVIGGNAFSGTVADLFDYETAGFNKVSMLIANNDGSKQASIGLMLGRIARIPSQRSIARIKDGPIEDIQTYFTSTSTIETLEASWDAIHDKGYTFFRTLGGRSGYYFTDDRTLSNLSNDFSALARGFVMDEALMIAYDTLVEELSDEILINEAGQIHPAIIKNWQTNVDTQLRGLMVNQGKLSNVEIYINETQNVLANDTLIVNIRLQPVGYAKFIEVNIGFTAQVNN